MPPPAFCPSCETPLALFTPREAQSHVNQCLDAQQTLERTDSFTGEGEALSCAVCSRDLSALTPAARNDHVNRCVDANMPFQRRPTRRTRRRARSPVPLEGPPSHCNRGQSMPTTSEGDPRVNHLLRMLGLQRFTARFAQEEIDLVALRLLSEQDLAELSIPEAGRRRIADAMHSVEILAQLQRAYRGNPPSFPSSQHITHKPSTDLNNPGDIRENEFVGTPLVPTQRFTKSRLKHRTHQVLSNCASIDDDEYIPSVHSQRKPERTSIKKKPDKIVAVTGENVAISGPLLCDESTEAYVERPKTTPSSAFCNHSSSRDGTGSAKLRDKPRGCINSISENLSENEDEGKSSKRLGRETLLDENVFNHSTKERPGQNVFATAKATMVHSPSPRATLNCSQGSFRSEISSLASNLEDMDEALRSTSRISMNLKLKKWRDCQISREKLRHKRILRRIDESYYKALKRTADDSSTVAGLSGRKVCDGSHHGGAKDSKNMVNLTQDFHGRIDIVLKEKENAQKDEQHDGVYVIDQIGKGICTISSGTPMDGGDPRQEDMCGGYITGSSARKERKSLNSLSPSVSSSSIPPIDFEQVRQDADAILGRDGAEDLGCSDISLKLDNDSSGEILDLLNDTGNVSDTDSCLQNGEHVGQFNGASNSGSESEVLDLVGVDDDGLNEFGSPLKDMEDVDEAEGGTQSRLKKQPRGRKATNENISSAIRADGELYDCILQMHSVPFQRIWDSIKQANLRASKNALQKFLLSEGVMFHNGSSSRPGGQRFLRLLNTDARNE